MKIFNYDFDTALRPSQEPEVVPLGSQTIQEVKDILKKARAAECENVKATLESFEELNEACEEAEEVKLSYEKESVPCDETYCDLTEARHVYGFKKTLDQFALWRKLADVKVGDENVEPEMLNPTKELMDYILVKLEKTFPKLELSWTEDTWNPSLAINNCATQVTMEKLALSYQGLLNLTEEINAQAIIANIVVKKLKELFV